MVACKIAKLFGFFSLINSTWMYYRQTDGKKERNKEEKNEKKEGRKEGRLCTDLSKTGQDHYCAAGEYYT